MPKIAMSAAGSARLLRRHTDTDALDATKSKSRSRRSRYLPRLLSSTRSLSRFSSFSSASASAGSACADGGSEGSDVASTAISTVAEESTVIADETADDHILTSTVIDIHEHVVKVGDRDQDREEVDDEGANGCDDFFERLVDMMQCNPSNQVHDEAREAAPATDIHGTDIDMTKIECILKQAMDESPVNYGRDSPQSTDAQQTDIKELPPPSEWVLEPLLLVATPGQSGMQVRRIRRVSDPSYFESPQGEDLDNSRVIQLPINNGTEEPLHSWVIDFETDVFAGTALFRLRDSKGWESKQSTPPTTQSGSTVSSHDYFANQNRKFQMVVRGRFKGQVPMVDCMSGLLLDHHLATNKHAVNCVDLDELIPAECSTSIQAPEDRSKRVRGFRRKKSSRLNDDSLPPKWALRAAVKVAALFSPRMDADLECRHPRILSPLCSTAQIAYASRPSSREKSSVRLCDKHVEPRPLANSSIVKDLITSSSTKIDSNSSTNDVQQRKRLFDAAYDARVESLAKKPGQVDNTPCFDTDSEYTFEFLQHLLDYNDLSVNLGKVLGKVRLGGALRGQPVRFISAAVKQRDINASTKSHLNMGGLDCLWSFDLWHKSLVM